MGNKIIHQLLIAALGIVIMLTPAYSATVLPYSDATVFGGLTQDMTLVTFDDQIGPGGYRIDYVGGGFGVGGVQFAGTAGAYATSLAWKPNTQIDWAANAVLQSSGGNAGHLHIALPNGGSTAVGLNLMSWMSAGTNAYSSGADFKIQFSTGDILTPITTASWNTSIASSPNAAHIAATWFGVTSETPITYMDVFSDEGVTIVIDNFQFGTADVTPPPPPPADTPEASTMILIGGGLASLGLIRKFRTQHAI